MIYSSHPSFVREMNGFLKKHHQDDGWLYKLQSLLTNHFELGVVRLGIEVLAPIGEYENYKLFKVYMAIGGISKNDRPRVCFATDNKSIIFLCFGTHINNYKTRDLIFISKTRIKEFIGATPK